MSTYPEFAVHNSEVNGSVMLSNMTVENTRAMAFQNSRAQNSVTAGAGGSPPVMSYENFVQATIGSLLVKTADSANPQYISVGPDTVEQAAAIIKVFNITSTDDRRVLRLCLNSQLAGGTITLENTSGTSSNVVVTGGVIFNSANNAPGASAGNLPGYERIVILKATNLTVGSEAVNFTVEQYSV